MMVLSSCWRGSRRQALRGLRKGLGGSSEGGNTGRRADWPCHINIAGDGEIAETVRSAPGRDPRMARFIRVLARMARKRAGCLGLNFGERRGARNIAHGPLIGNALI